MSLGKKVASSAILLFIRKIWGNLINLIVMAFLARLLSKEDFGLLAISSVFLSIINTVGTSGIAEYIVYYDGEERREKINAAFWLNLFLTIGVIIVVLITGKWWAEFYDNPKIYSILLLLLVSFFFEMTSTVPKAMLRKELEYKSLVFYSGAAMTMVSVGKLLAAWAGFGVYSLALPQAMVSPFLMLALFFKAKWRPAFDVPWSHFRSIFQYSKHIIGGRVLSKLVNEGDNLIVGKFIGLEGLGIYTLAFQLANIVTTNVVFLVNDIVLPVLSKVKSDFIKLKSTYLQMISILALITFPLITALVLTADAIVYIIYGTKWSEAILPFQILSVFALSRSINSPTSSLFNAQGRPDINFKFALYFSPIFLISVYVGSFSEVVGVAVSTTIVRFVGALFLIALALKLIDSQWKELWGNLKHTVLISLFTFCVFSFLLLDLNFEYQYWLKLFFIPLVLYCYFLFYRVFYTSRLIDLITYLGNVSGYKMVIVLLRQFLFIHDKKKFI